MSNTKRNAVVLVVDGLGSHYLGPYGNSWLPTPAMNHLASTGLVGDVCLTDALNLHEVYRSFWTGQHSMFRARSAAPPWIRALNQSGVRTSLSTDSEEIAHHSLSAHFSMRHIYPHELPEELAGSIDETNLLRSMAHWIGSLEQLEPPFCSWMHTQGLLDAWDAPYAYRAQFASDDDPQPPHVLHLEDRELPVDSIDPDERLGWLFAYAGQLKLLDECLTLVLEFLEQRSWWDETLFLLTSPRGYPLGEHGVVGHVPESLHAEAVQVPLFLRLPGDAVSQLRTPSLLQPPDVAATLMHWFGLSATPEVSGVDLTLLAQQPWSQLRDRALVCGSRQWGLRTDAWYLIQDRDGTAAADAHLYSKPDDRWEVNEVSERVPLELAEVQAELAKLATRTQPGDG